MESISESTYKNLNEFSKSNTQLKSEQFYNSFNDIFNTENESKDSKETIAKEDSSKNKIYINIENVKKPTFNCNKNKPTKKFGINEIDKFFNLSNEESFINELEELNLSKIEKYKGGNKSISSIDEYIYEENKITFKLENLFKKIDLIQIVLLKDFYFRFPYIKKNNENENNNILNYIYCIPKVLYKEGKIIFIYENKEINLEIEEILNLIIDKKMFIEKNNKEILEEAYICQLHKKNFINYCSCKKNICKECNHFLHEEYSLKKNINITEIKYLENKINDYKEKLRKIYFIKKEIKNILFELNNKYYNDFYKEILKKKLFVIYKRIKFLLALSIYILIIKALIFNKRKE